MNAEQERLQHLVWKKWGPYVSDRQWGTVREDYSANGDAWNYSTHDMARSKAYRWGEEGIGGICDDRQLLCFSLVLWNRRDPILKEVYYGLANKQGNHGEDVKELYYYLDSTPTHSYMKMLYKYPQAAFPYADLLAENMRRSRQQPEYEIFDTGVFDSNAYFDVFIEYAKAGPEDILVRITACNRGAVAAPLEILPTLWFRNTWTWTGLEAKPLLGLAGDVIEVAHPDVGVRGLHFEGDPEPLFCNNETNPHRFVGNDTEESYYKDGINDYLVKGLSTVDLECLGTKAALRYSGTIPPGECRVVRLRLSPVAMGPAAMGPAAMGSATMGPAATGAVAMGPAAFADFDAIFATRIAEADAFYGDLQQRIPTEDERRVHRQALGGILWNKQFYYYNVQQWLEGDPNRPTPPAARKEGRNYDWKHLHNDDIVSMPDKWEYPWYANWDLAFQCVTLALVDIGFAKHQLELLTKDWYMHPNGKMPAFEWCFNDANPPVFAFAAWEVYCMEGKKDYGFLESMFHKLLVNFTWWVNRKDTRGHNVFEGGFLGLDNIGVFDRNVAFSEGILEQADATSWMALFALMMLRISIELAMTNKRYLDMTSKFFSHFLYMAGAINIMGDGMLSLWDRDDRFFYDQVRRSDGSAIRLKVRSMVGLIPLFAVEVLDKNVLDREPEFFRHIEWFLENRPDLMALVTRWTEEGRGNRHLLSLVRDRSLRSVLSRMLDPSEFLSPVGIRSLSKYHEEHPYTFTTGNRILSIGYVPGESDSDMYGGNSNWRGPIWFPVNYMLVRALKRFQDYYGDSFLLNGQTLGGAAQDLSARLVSLFVRDESGRRKVFGTNEQFQNDPHFKDHILFYEYFHAETGEGLGAAHQTGWTALVANLIQTMYE